jgi:hypothetical protein
VTLHLFVVLLLVQESLFDTRGSDLCVIIIHLCGNDDTCQGTRTPSTRDDDVFAELLCRIRASWRHARPETSIFNGPEFKDGLQLARIRLVSELAESAIARVVKSYDVWAASL